MKKSSKERRRDALEESLERKIRKHELKAGKTFSRTGHQLNHAAGAERALEKLRAKRAAELGEVQS